MNCSIFVLTFLMIALFTNDKGASASALRRTNKRNIFEGYTCRGHTFCQGGGRCLATKYESQYLCNCTHDRLGPNCELSVSKMKEYLNTRPLINYSFLSCLNTTSKQAGVDVYQIYHECHGGDTVCWLNQGGANAVKAFFWCLNTGYNALMVEGRPSNNARLGKYSDIFKKLARRDGLQELPASGENIVNPSELSVEFHADGIDSVPVFGSRGPIPSVPDVPLVSENRENGGRIFEERTMRLPIREFPTMHPDERLNSPNQEGDDEVETEANLALINSNNPQNNPTFSPFLQRLGFVNRTQESISQYLKRKLNESSGEILTQQNVFDDRIAVLSQDQPSKKSSGGFSPQSGPFGIFDSQPEDQLDNSNIAFSFEYNLVNAWADNMDFDDISSSP